MTERKQVFGSRLFQTEKKTTTEEGKREYMRQYMRAYRDRNRKRKFSSHLRKDKEC